MSWKNLFVAKDLIESLKFHAQKNGFISSADYSALFEDNIFLGVSILEYLETEVKNLIPFLNNKESKDKNTEDLLMDLISILKTIYI